jgi:Transposase DDE domain
VGPAVYPPEQGGEFRHEPAVPAAQLITSPYDPDARNAKKRTTYWTGYKVHFTQTCDDEAPQLITHVETTAAPLSDEGVVSRIHAELAKKDLLPEQHLMDSGYVTVTNLVHARAEVEVDLVGPTMKTHWYQAETGYDLTHFCIDWEAEQVTCPQGHVSSSWTPVQEADKMLIKIKFSQSDCKVCPSQNLCTGTTRRSLTLYPKEQMQALFAARAREQTVAFKDTYRHRAGIEGTHSQAVRAMGLRRSRYIGLSKTHLGHIAVATAVNLIRLMSFLRGDAPEQTRLSAFKRVMKQAA